MALYFCECKRERERESCFFAMLKFGSGSRSGLD